MFTRKNVLHGSRKIGPGRPSTVLGHTVTSYSLLTPSPADPVVAAVGGRAAGCAAGVGACMWHWLAAGAAAGAAARPRMRQVVAAAAG